MTRKEFEKEITSERKPVKITGVARVFEEYTHATFWEPAEYNRIDDPEYDYFWRVYYADDYSDLWCVKGDNYELFDDNLDWSPLKASRYSEYEWDENEDDLYKWEE